MMGFGNFGGFAFPTRRAFNGVQPDSQPVINEQAEWEAFNSDWQQRFDAEAARGIAGTRATREYLPTFQWMEDMNMRGGPWAPVSDMGKPQFQQGWMSEDFGGTKFGHDAKGVFMQMGQDSTGYTPDFTALNAERAAREAEFALARENQTRQQQAYDTVLNGDGYIGGVINENYTNPTAGQITGRPVSFGGMGGFGGALPPAMGTMGGAQAGSMPSQQASASGVMGQAGGGDLTGISPDTMGLYQGASGLYRPQTSGFGF